MEQQESAVARPIQRCLVLIALQKEALFAASIRALLVEISAASAV
jgi:hypothetical protein